MTEPWERRMRAKGLRGLFYRWLYGDKRKQAIRKEFAKRRR